MNRILKSILFTGLILIVITTACRIEVVTPAEAVPPTPIPPTETLTATPTEIIPTASATPEFAPFCQPDAASVSPAPQCRPLAAVESSTFCQDKEAYNLILIDQGLTYEVLTDKFRCTDAGTKDDKQLIACTGQFTANFAINVCDPSCVVPTVQAAVTKCPSGYLFNNLQGCCTNEPLVLNPNCQAFTFTTTYCIVRCFEFQREQKCKRNPTYCVWNEKDEICELRR
jgi:hypothetical protein